MGTAGQPPERRPHRRNRSLARRRRRRPPRPPTNRSRTATSGVRPLATEPRPRRCPVQPPRWRRCRETPGWRPLSRSPARRSTSHASSTRCSSECPARAPRVSPVSAQEIWVINACARAPNKMARRKRSTCAQDRLQFSEALGLATTVTGLGRSLSTDCRSKGVPSDHCWIVFTVTSNSEVPAGEVSLRYELEPTGGPDAGPGLPGW
jgi:hypothetical protein